MNLNDIDEKSLKKMLKEHIEDIDRKIVEVKDKEISMDMKQWFINYLEANKKAWSKLLETKDKESKK